jgi:hypothetical protein
MFKRILHSPLDLSWQRNGNAIQSTFYYQRASFIPNIAHCSCLLRAPFLLSDSLRIHRWAALPNSHQVETVLCIRRADQHPMHER